jgi:HlyD family secretion protein
MASGETGDGGMRRVALAAAVVLAAALAGWLIWRALAPRRADADVLSGYIEGQSLYLAAPIAGTVTSVEVVEGQRVAAGAPLFSIDARTLAAERDQARAQLDQARAQAQAARDSQRQQAAGLALAQAQAANAERDAARYAGLQASKAGAVSVQDADRVRTAAQTARAQRDAAQDLFANARAQAAAADAAAGHALAALDEAQARLDQLSVRAPAAGRLEEVYFQTGEWAAANQAIVSLIPDDRVKVRFYVPAGEVALYQVGARVRFDCDSCRDGQGARIIYVSPSPEYTPPIIYSRKARDRLVFLIEALPDDARTLNPGQPVDVTPLGHAKAAGA